MHTLFPPIWLLAKISGHPSCFSYCTTEFFTYTSKKKESQYCDFTAQHFSPDRSNLGMQKGSTPCKQRAEPIKSIDTQKLFNYSMIEATQPEPTVLPPSRYMNSIFRCIFICFLWLKSTYFRWFYIVYFYLHDFLAPELKSPFIFHLNYSLPTTKYLF